MENDNALPSSGGDKGQEHRLIVSLVMVAAFMGVLSLVGWATGIRSLAALRESYFPMPPSMAIGIILFSLTFSADIFWSRSVMARMVAKIVQLALMLVAARIMYEYVVGIDPGIEENLFQVHGEMSGIPVGRMSPLAAALIFLSSASLLIFSLLARTHRWPRTFSTLLAIIVVASGSIITLGYLYGTPLLYGGSTRPVAATAGIAWSLLGIAITMFVGAGIWPTRYFYGQRVEARMLHNFLPLILILILVEGWVVSVIPNRFNVNPVFLSSISAVVLLFATTAMIVRISRTLGGSIDRADAKRLKAEAKLQQLLVELARSNAELEQFAYVASHDLQEPLRMVSSYMQLLERRYAEALDDDAREFIGYAVDGAERMQYMIRDLLALSRLGTRGKPFVVTDCEEVLTTALQDLEVAVDESGAEITHELLPEIVADPSQLVNLFQNLIGNAIKFHGNKPPQIHISAVKNNSEWVFSFRDLGIGFNQEYAQKIFVIFQRLQGRTEFGGTGIGLALCKKIVERHGGRIWAEAEPGKGATFMFTIPDRKVGE